MKEQYSFNRAGRREGVKRPGLHGVICLLFILCCSLTAFVIFQSAQKLPIIKIGNNETPVYVDIASIPNAAGSIIDHSADNVPDAVRNADSAEETPWYLILVNRWNYVPDDYEMELTELSNGQSVDKRIYPALQEMFDAARNDDVYPTVVSGYRTMEKQRQLMEEKISEYKGKGFSAEEAAAKAEMWVAIPGTSEHQLGIAVDINSDGKNSTNEEVYEWLRQNAYKYGFICRYADDKTEITGINGEPWHYRYVGTEAAVEIWAGGVCLEEYLGVISEYPQNHKKPVSPDVRRVTG